MRGLFVLLLLSLAGCATTRASSESDWLVGSWLMMEGDVEFPLACESGLPIHYSRDGTYVLFEGDGTWRLRGDRLTETATDSAADEPEAAIGVPFTSRIQRIGPDEFRKTFAGGEAATFRRCPSEP